jgi:DNA-binding transcriptional ArsR family regulator
MKEGPDIAMLGALIGDPARANILTALMGGKALTATELSAEAGVTIQTTSSHLKKLEGAKLLRLRKQGRHRYFALADDDVGSLLETMMGLAAKRGLLKTMTGPKDKALRKARICYDHLAGDLGVHLYDSMIANGRIKEAGEQILLTAPGIRFVVDFGIDIDNIQKLRRPLCKSCLDWSSRRTHLAGALGTAFLNRFYELRWTSLKKGSRVIEFSRYGEAQFLQSFSS